MATFSFKIFLVCLHDFWLKKRESSVNERQLTAVDGSGVCVCVCSFSSHHDNCLQHISSRFEKDSCVLHTIVPGSNVPLSLLLKTGPAFH